MKNQAPLLSVVLVLLVLLPGCAVNDWFKKWFGSSQEERATEVVDTSVEQQSSNNPAKAGQPLLTLNGKTVMSVEEFEKEKEKILSCNPQYKMLAAMDPSFDEQVAESLLNQLIIDQHIQEKKINRTEAYKTALQDGYKLVESAINRQFFIQELPIEVSDEEIRAFYEENRDIIPYAVISQGGVRAQAVRFANQKDAAAFAQRVKEQEHDLVKVLPFAGVTADKIENLKTVHEESIGLDPQVRNAILTVNTFPQALTIPVKENEVWVVVATGKEESKYRSYEQVKNELKKSLEKDKRAERFNDELAMLKEKYGATIDQSYFAAAHKEAPAFDAAMFQQLLQEEAQEDIAS